MSLHDGSRWTAHEVRDRATVAYITHNDLSLPEWSTYLILDSYANGAPECWPSLTRILSHAPIGRSTLIRALEGLEARGLIERQHGGGERGSGGTTNRYRILDPQDCTGPNEGSPGAGRPGAGLEVVGITKNLRAEQQELNQEEPNLKSRSGTSRSGTTQTARAARREATPDPKPVKQVTGELTQGVDRKVKRRRARTAPAEEVVVSTPSAPRFMDGGPGAPGAPRKSAADRANDVAERQRQRVRDRLRKRHEEEARRER